MRATLAAMLTLAVLAGDAGAYVRLSDWLESPDQTDRQLEDEAFGDEFERPPE